MKKRLFLSAVAAIGCACSAASAQSVEIDTYQGASSTPYSTTTVASGSDITINADSTISRVCIYTFGGGSAANIGAVSVNHAGGTARSSELQVILMNLPANFDVPGFTDDLTPVATDWAGVAFDSGTAPWAAVAGSISGNLTGAVTANKIVRVEVGDELSGAITATLSSGTAVGWVEAASSTSGGTIAAIDGDIDTIKGTSTSGTLAGATSAINGHIANVLVDGSINISTGGIRAQDGIDFITAKSITGDITANANGGTGSILRINVTGGDLAGTVHMHDLGVDDLGLTGINVTGKLGDAVIDGDLLDPIVVGVPSNDPPNEVYLHSLTVNGNFANQVFVRGNIGSIEIAGNMATGDYPVAPLISGGWYIGSVHVGGYADGSVGPGEDNRPGIIGLEDIGSIAVDGNANFYLQNSTGPEYINVADLEVGGDLMGSILLGEFGSVVVHGGIINKPGTSETTGISLRAIPAGHTIYIGDSLDLNSVSIGDDTSDFGGQIVVNANAGEDATLDCAVPFVVGRYPDRAFLTPLPYYDTLSADFGGGALGLVPYHLHGADCVPPNNAQVCDAWPTFFHHGSARETFRLRFYGPVLDGTDDSTPPVIITRTPLGGSPTDITAACDVYVAPEGFPREIWISPKNGTPLWNTFGRNMTVEVAPRRTGGLRDLRCGSTFVNDPPPGGSRTSPGWRTRPARLKCWT